MKRRNFLIGAGSAAIGGSALLGSGAFSRVEAHRSMTVQIAEDPQAYLGMDDCMDSDGNETPNSSYALIDEFGHLEVDMTPTNPTEGGGEGVNSDSITWADNVFQICNQGKESVCLWISEKTGADPDRVTLYVDADTRDGSGTPERLTDDDPRTREQVENDGGLQTFLGVDDSIQLEVGECVCVGIEVYTKEDDDFEITAPAEGDQLIDEISLVADVNETACEGPGEQATCSIYGIDQETDDPGIRAVDTGSGVSPGVSRAGTSLATLTQPSTQNYPNGLAHAGDGQTFYFADDDGVFWELSGVPQSFTEYGPLEGGNKVAGATYYDGPAGTYYYIPQGGNELKVVDPSSLSAGDTPSPSTVTTLSDISTVNLGDLAVDEATDTAYISIVSGSNDGAFVEIDLASPSGGTVLLDGVSNASSSVSAAGKQIAFGLDENGAEQLYAHEAAGENATGDWYEVEPGDIQNGNPGAGVTQVDNTETFTDLAQCGPLTGSN